MPVQYVVDYTTVDMDYTQLMFACYCLIHRQTHLSCSTCDFEAVLSAIFTNQFLVSGILLTEFLARRARRGFRSTTPS